MLLQATYKTGQALSGNVCSYIQTNICNMICMYIYIQWNLQEVDRLSAADKILFPELTRTSNLRKAATSEFSRTDN